MELIQPPERVPTCMRVEGANMAPGDPDERQETQSGTGNRETATGGARFSGWLDGWPGLPEVGHQ